MYKLQCVQNLQYLRTVIQFWGGAIQNLGGLRPHICAYGGIADLLPRYLLPNFKYLRAGVTKISCVPQAQFLPKGLGVRLY